MLSIEFYKILRRKLKATNINKIKIKIKTFFLKIDFEYYLFSVYKGVDERTNYFPKKSI